MIEIHYKNPAAPKPNQPWLPSVHGIVRNEQGAVLLHRRDDHSSWAFPGGKLELGESLEVCLAREMLEETGLEVAVERLLGVFSSPEYVLALEDKTFQPLLIVFLCRMCGGGLRVGPESLSFMWMNQANMETLQTFPLTKDIARFIWSGNQNAFFDFFSLGIKN
ncbi:NUDIX domain-containing protein [Candidatus Parcubacteria bacterium]|nr:NUDIX domain-containing protein [Candidatus Parcubacteria bacterium]